MKAIKDFFKSFKWWEYVYMFLFSSVIIILGILFKSDILVIISAILGIFSVFFIAKGRILGNIVGIVQCVLYSIISAINLYYGEVVLSCCITIPTYVLSIITWIKNLTKKEKVVKVNRRISWKEWLSMFAVVAAIAVGVYYMLRAFNTANLLISTFGVAFTMCAGYLLVRRCEYSFVFYIFNNFSAITLWSITIANGQISNVPTLIQMLIFFILNIVGIINWVMLKRSQKEEIQDKQQIEEEESGTSGTGR